MIYASPEQPIDTIPGAVSTELQVFTRPHLLRQRQTKLEHVLGRKVVALCNRFGDCLFALETPPARVVSSIQISLTPLTGTERSKLDSWKSG